MASGFLSVEAHMRHPQSPLLWIQPSELVVGQSTFNSMPITKNDMYQKTHSFEPMIYIYSIYSTFYYKIYIYYIMFWTSTHHPCSKQCKYQGIRHPEPQNVASKLSLKCYKIPADRNSELQSAASTTSLHKHNQRII